MEQNLPIIAKKVWSLVRVMFFALKKGISKTKFLADLNVMMKRGRIAGKTLQNLLFHHHHNWAASTFQRHPHHLPSGEYEFSCRSTPSYSHSLFSIHKKHKNNRLYHSSSPIKQLGVGDCDDLIIDEAVLKVLGMLTSATKSPVLGNSPMAEQMKITDSPFPVTNGGEDGHVDEAAEKFIRRFYNDLRREK